MKSEKRRFENCRFAPETVKDAIRTFDCEMKGLRPVVAYLNVTIDGTERGHDDETEFFADYRKAPENVDYKRCAVGENSAVHAEMRFSTFKGLQSQPAVTVEVQAGKWSQILAVMEVFESARSSAELPPPPKEPP